MTTAIEILQALGSFLTGLAGRFGLFFLAGLALALPGFAFALVWRAIEGRRERRETLPRGAHLAPNHTWLAPGRRGAMTVGVDEIAQRILPSATAVELPRRGMLVHRGDPIAVIRAGRRAVHVGAPADGTIVAVNRGVRRNPALVKSDPYGRGWLFAIAPAEEGWRRLPSDARAEAWLVAERARLVRFVEDELGIAAADGGDVVSPAPALLGEEGWRRAVSSFLNAA